MFPSRFEFRSCLAAIGFALCLPLSATAQEQGRAAPDPKDPALAPRVPLVRTVAPARPTAPMRLRARPSAIPEKTEHFIDSGLEQPAAELTPRERAKLEAARVAVAAARAAQGGATAPVVRSLDLAMPLHAIEAGERSKFERMRLTPPSPVASDPGKSGLPPVLQSRQKQGAKEPSARELEKLKAKPTSSVTPETQKETER